ncbi:MAG: DNA translocase FtsK 4TM domain-containing protein, partial [Alistipes sp.]|nr:DNA translocase FtsK 4TM domain-containing protein [Alistipes sp.]
MTQKSKKTTKGKVATPPSNDNMLWMVGFVMLVFGILSIFSVLSHFVNWSSDLTALRNDAALSGVVIPYENICSSLGAHIAYWVVDCSFGVFGLILPVVITLLGWRVFRKKSLHFNHLMLSALLLMVVGAVTMGFISAKFSLSYDLGGRWGQACASDLSGIIGDFGVVMVLLAAWVLVGVYINRKVISLVNKSVDGMVQTGENVVVKVKDRIAKHDKALDESPEDEVGDTKFVEEKDDNLNVKEDSEKVAEKTNDDYEFVVVGGEDMQQPVDVDVLLKPESEDDASVSEDISDDDYIFTTENAEEAPADEEEVVVYEASEEDVAAEDTDENIYDDDNMVITVREHKVKTLSEEELEIEPYNPLLDLEYYKKPHVSLLEDYKSPNKVSDAEIVENKRRIQETLKYFGIPITNIEATIGPTVTLYEITQAQGVKISKIQGLEKDIAQSLRAQGIRIIAPIPGRGTIGIEVPNRDKQIVSMYSSICSEEFQSSKAELPIVIGRTIQNQNFTFDLAKLPHLLVAGATGKGKSVGLNAIITSLLYKKHPAELKFVMIDPKMVEFSVYSKIENHFLAKMESEEEPIITDPKKAVYVLNSLVEEMGARLKLLKMATARNIVEYNEKFTSR